MSDPVINSAQVIELFSEIRVLGERVQSLESMQQKQQAALDELIALANKGKGSFWIIVTLSGLMGAALSNFKTLLSFFATR